MGFEFAFTLEHVPEALRMMLVGMAGIFLVLGIIYVASLALQKLFPADKE